MFVPRTGNNIGLNMMMAMLSRALADQAKQAGVRAQQGAGGQRACCCNGGGDRMEMGGTAGPQLAPGMSNQKFRDPNADPQVQQQRMAAQVGNARPNRATQAQPNARQPAGRSTNEQITMRDLENRRFRGFREVDVNKLRQALPPQARHLAQTFIDAGRRNNLDPLALAAIARHETGNFTSSAFRNKNNAMGVSNARGPRTMQSHEQSINYMAQRLASPTGPYRNAQSLKDLWHVYSPPASQNGGRPVSNDPRDLNRHWGAGVERFIRDYERAVR